MDYYEFLTYQIFYDTQLSRLDPKTVMGQVVGTNSVYIQNYSGYIYSNWTTEIIYLVVESIIGLLYVIFVWGADASQASYTAPVAITSFLSCLIYWLQLLIGWLLPRSNVSYWLFLAKTVLQQAVPFIYMVITPIHLFSIIRTIYTRQKCGAGILYFIAIGLSIALSIVLISTVFDGVSPVLTYAALVGHGWAILSNIVTGILILFSPCICCCGHSPDANSDGSSSVQYAKRRLLWIVIFLAVTNFPLLPTYCLSIERVFEMITYRTYIFDYKFLAWRTSYYNNTYFLYSIGARYFRYNWVGVLYCNQDVFRCLFVVASFILLPTFRRVVFCCQWGDKKTKTAQATVEYMKQMPVETVMQPQLPAPAAQPSAPPLQPVQPVQSFQQPVQQFQQVQQVQQVQQFQPVQQCQQHLQQVQQVSYAQPLALQPNLLQTTHCNCAHGGQQQMVMQMSPISNPTPQQYALVPMGSMTTVGNQVALIPQQRTTDGRLVHVEAVMNRIS